MVDVRIFADDDNDLAAVYVDGQLRHYAECYDSEAQRLALLEFGVQVEYDSSFQLGWEYDGGDLPFEKLAQTLEEIEDFRRNRENIAAQRKRERELERIRDLRRQARTLQDKADEIEREMEPL